MNIGVSGGCGFIGSNFIRHLFRHHPFSHLINIDALTYAGHRENLLDLEADQMYVFREGDISDPHFIEQVMAEYTIDSFIHFAAETHVDRSILDPSPFVQTNVAGTTVLLEAARRHGFSRFIHISTDEVYGSLGTAGNFSEDSPLAPRNPYSASKAAADHFVAAYSHTFGIPSIITRCSNNYGPYQSPEKFIPLMIIRAIEGKPLPLYGDGGQIRDWIFVEDHCRAIELILRQGHVGETYNIGGASEETNLAIAQRILRLLGGDEEMIAFVQDRPGHDRRYAIDFSKLQSALQRKPDHSLDEGLTKTIQWYQEHEDWWRPLLDESFQQYFLSNYGMPY